jgi:hypothetical protein
VLPAEHGGHYERGGDGDGEPPRRAAAGPTDLDVTVDTTVFVAHLDDERVRVSHVTSDVAHATGHGG